MAKREFSGVDIKVEFNETANRQQISSGGITSGKMAVLHRQSRMFSQYPKAERDK